ncbi:MAG: phage holin family protein [Phenylobacterium sp.]|uniref:phage holin family protein n=1 Tax=Phenylobacterium sp. TaxID=1871053 RepID=UPI002A2D2178|nr:phage holin family protein [Phenylobacterium sp.]MDD3837886.1 phage holin family protein [Phenylobacterium sp.]MDX9998660.1 phage holin family protein [Phenylobacterium sp.]
MARFILRALIAALGLWLSDALLGGIWFSDWVSLLVAAVLLGLVNAVVRPIVFWLTLPLTIITLGLFLLVVNAAMIGLVALVLPGFTVAGLGSGVAAAVITGLVSWLGSALIKDER